MSQSQPIDFLRKYYAPRKPRPEQEPVSAARFFRKHRAGLLILLSAGVLIGVNLFFAISPVKKAPARTHDGPEQSFAHPKGHGHWNP